MLFLKHNLSKANEKLRLQDLLETAEDKKKHWVHQQVPTAALAQPVSAGH